MRDYQAWHRDYDDPASELSQRLRVVQQRLRERLDALAPGPVRVISMCAGQGRDLIPVLARHPRRADVSAALLEIDHDNAAYARQLAADARLDTVTVVEADAGSSDPYEPYAPANILLACGIFGNITDGDLENTVGHLSMLCRPGASVIWTRHWKQPDLITSIRKWFQASGFDDLGFEALDTEAKMGVGVSRLSANPKPFVRSFRFFTFVR
ncbi:MAG TPA: SAM-dependent methyltransferase [Candidatus Dormibacteraeota bacterium]